MVILVPSPQPFQNPDALLWRRLFHHDLLEAALQRGILLDIFAVLCVGRSADQLNISARQRRFQDIGRIHRSL